MTDNTLPPHLLPMTKRKRAQLDRQLGRQRRYEETLNQKKAPTREHFVGVVLDLVLGVIEHYPQTGQARMARGVLVDELVAAGFDNLQCHIRLDGMCERLERDRAQRRYLRELAAKNEAAAGVAASAADTK